MDARSITTKCIAGHALVLLQPAGRPHKRELGAVSSAAIRKPTPSRRRCHNRPPAGSNGSQAAQQGEAARPALPPLALPPSPFTHAAVSLSASERASGRSRAGAAAPAAWAAQRGPATAPTLRAPACGARWKLPWAWARRYAEQGQGSRCHGGRSWSLPCLKRRRSRSYLTGWAQVSVATGLCAAVAPRSMAGLNVPNRPPPRLLLPRGAAGLMALSSRTLMECAAVLEQEEDKLQQKIFAYLPPACAAEVQRTGACAGHPGACSIALVPGNP